MKIFATIKLLNKVFGKYRWHVAVLGVLGVVSGLLAGFGIGAVVPLLSFLVGGSGSEPVGSDSNILSFLNYLPFTPSLRNILLLIIFIFIFRAAVILLFNYVTVRIRSGYRYYKAKDLMDKMLKAKWQFFVNQKTGHLHEILLKDTDWGAKMLDATAQALLSFTNAAILFVFALSLSFPITIFSAVVGLVFMLVFGPLMRMIREVARGMSTYSKDVSQYVVETMTGLKVIKSGRVENKIFEKGLNHFKIREKLDVKRAILTSLPSISIEPISIIVVMGAFAVSYKSPGFNFQTFAATMFMIHKIFTYLGNGQSSLHLFNDAIPHVANVTALEESLDREKELDLAGGKSFDLRKSLSFHNVSFSYNQDKPIFDGLSFDVMRGEVIGLIGPSGVGKTSIADLIMRFFQPDSGSITLDGLDSTEYDLSDWRRNIGYVAQEPFLLNDTVENNIRFYNQDLGDEVVKEAARKANVYNHIIGMPDQFKTIIGERGLTLSGGQRQRIALARVLARKPKILILDEATSSLDSESESSIQESIQSIRGDVTVFVIAHRLSTVKDVDNLLVLDRGKIVESGKPSGLLQNPSSYFYQAYHKSI